MLDKLKQISNRFEEVGQLIVLPETMSDMKKYAQLNKEYKELSDIVEQYKKLQDIKGNIKNAKEIIATEKDAEFRELAKEELEQYQEDLLNLEEKLKVMLIPKDPNDGKNAILEIRAGTGGDEAGIFAGDLYRMYQRYGESQKWTFNVMDVTEGTSGGYKEVIVAVSGDDVYGKLKFESGVHRVQRVPATETQGRIHTSAASVAVLPEAEELEVNIATNDIKKEIFCASGPGGQSVNTTYSAVRLTHIPTGISAQCQDEKSQIKNLDKAMKVLRSRIFEIEQQKKNAEVGAQRKSMVGSGDRSDKIRTYNYPQGRVTDHRIGLTVYNLPNVINGDLNEFVEKLRIAENSEKMNEDSVMG